MNKSIQKYMLTAAVATLMLSAQGLYARTNAADQKRFERLGRDIAFAKEALLISTKQTAATDPAERLQFYIDESDRLTKEINDPNVIITPLNLARQNNDEEVVSLLQAHETPEEQE